MLKKRETSPQTHIARGREERNSQNLRDLVSSQAAAAMTRQTSKVTVKCTAALRKEEEDEWRTCPMGERNIAQS